MGQTALEVIEAMLQFNPAARITVQDAIRSKYFESLFEEEDMEHDTRVTPVDWTFDNFEPTKPLLQNYIYCECADFHPEIADRDRSSFATRGIDKLLERFFPQIGSKSSQ